MSEVVKIDMETKLDTDARFIVWTLLYLCDVLRLFRTNRASQQYIHQKSLQSYIRALFAQYTWVVRQQTDWISLHKMSCRLPAGSISQLRLDCSDAGYVDFLKDVKHLTLTIEKNKSFPLVSLPASCTETAIFDATSTKIVYGDSSAPVSVAGLERVSTIYFLQCHPRDISKMSCWCNLQRLCVDTEWFLSVKPESFREFKALKWLRLFRSVNTSDVHAIMHSVWENCPTLDHLILGCMNLIEKSEPQNGLSNNNNSSKGTIGIGSMAAVDLDMNRFKVYGCSCAIHLLEAFNRTVQNYEAQVCQASDKSLFETSAIQNRFNTNFRNHAEECTCSGPAVHRACYNDFSVPECPKCAQNGICAADSQFYNLICLNRFMDSSSNVSLFKLQAQDVSQSKELYKAQIEPRHQCKLWRENFAFFWTKLNRQLRSNHHNFEILRFTDII